MNTKRQSSIEFSTSATAVIITIAATGLAVLALMKYGVLPVI